MTAHEPLLLRVEHLVKHFAAGRGLFGRGDPVRAVDGVSLAIPRGETVALVGESGSGKTTLGRCVVRLTNPTSGSVSFDGVDVLALGGPDMRALRRRVQIVFQDPAGSLNPRMTAGTAVREPLEVHGIARGDEAHTRVDALFAEVGLDPSLTGRYPHELSGGQKQRVGIARALSIQPDFIVLDEPVSALDVSVQAQVVNLLVELQQARNLTYLFIAHDLAVVRHIADRIAVMYLGKIVETGDVDPLYGRPLHPYTVSLLSAVPVPDPTATRNRVALPGEMPSPRRPPPGCPFHPRCPHMKKDERCSTEAPALREMEPGRWAACHFADTPMARPAPPTAGGNP
jgi:oligopeptide/dipeptide ABC transporter ATP-binding protein